MGSLQAGVFASGKPFQPSLMFASKTGAYPSDAPFKYFTLRYFLGIGHKHKTRLERLERENTLAFHEHL